MDLCSFLTPEWEGLYSPLLIKQGVVPHFEKGGLGGFKISVNLNILNPSPASLFQSEEPKPANSKPAAKL